MTAHIHVNSMLLYAQDAATTDKPWELWEWSLSNKNDWTVCAGHPTWAERRKYRRKPKRSWYRVCLLKKDVSLVCTNLQEDWVTSHVDFVKWLTDRVYYDAE